MSKKMKPAYEIVAAAELRVGDFATYESPDEYEPFCVESIKPCEDDDDEIEVGLGPRLSMDLMKEEQVFRQLPPERNPDVLMRAMELLFDMLYDGNGRRSMMDSCIQEATQQAIRELESEAGDEQQGPSRTSPRTHEACKPDPEDPR